MTTFTKAQIPNSITSVEALAVWCGEVLTFVNPETSILVAAGTAELVAQTTRGQRFPLNVQSPKRTVVGLYMPETNDSGARLPWEGIAEVTAGQLPAQFRQSGT